MSIGGQLGGMNPPHDPAAQLRDAVPFYIVCDVSESMWNREKYQELWGRSEPGKPPPSPHGAMQGALNEIVDELADDDEVGSLAHVSIVTFAQEAWTHVNMSRVKDHPRVDPIDKGSWTNFVAAWELLAETVPSDLQVLREKARDPARPTIFFLTDGRPGSKTITQTTADWKRPYSLLFTGDPRLHPRVVSFGLGDVEDSVVRALHSKTPHGGAYKARNDRSVGALTRVTLEQIKNSIRDSSRGAFTFECPPELVLLCDRTCLPT